MKRKIVVVAALVLLVYPNFTQNAQKYYFTQTWRGIKTYSENSDGTITVVKSVLV